MRAPPVILCVIVLLAIALCSFVSAGGQAPASNIKVYFPLLGGCIKAALKHLDAARVSVLVQALQLYLRADSQGSQRRPQARR